MGPRGIQVIVTCRIFQPGRSTLLNTEKGVWRRLCKRGDRGPRRTYWKIWGPVVALFPAEGKKTEGKTGLGNVQSC